MYLIVSVVPRSSSVVLHCEISTFDFLNILFPKGDMFDKSKKLAVEVVEYLSA